MTRGTRRQTLASLPAQPLSLTEVSQLSWAYTFFHPEMAFYWPQEKKGSPRPPSALLSLACRVDRLRMCLPSGRGMCVLWEGTGEGDLRWTVGTACGWQHPLLPERWFLRQRTRLELGWPALSAPHLAEHKASVLLIPGEKTAVPSPQSTRWRLRSRPESPTAGMISSWDPWAYPDFVSLSFPC